MFKKMIGSFLTLAGIDLYRRQKRERKMSKAKQLEQSAALLAVGLYAGLANDVLIVYQDEALSIKTMVPKNDYRYESLKRVIQKNWRFVSKLNNGVKIYQKPL